MYRWSPFQAGRRKSPSIFPGAAIQLLALTQHQVSLHQSVGEQNEERLIHHRRYRYPMRSPSIKVRKRVLPCSARESTVEA
jgi:hypothetical protein